MALDDGLDALASKILDDTASYMTAEQKAASITPMKTFLTDVMAHIADNAEVSANGGGVDTLGGTHVAGLASPTNLASTGTVS